MIPTTVNAWLEGGPWKRSSVEFWSAVTSGNFPETFMIHESSVFDDDRTTHEIAHCITATDEQLFLPCWGFKEFIPVHGMFTLGAAIQEMKTAVVQVVIDRYMRKNRILLSEQILSIRHECVEKYEPHHSLFWWEEYQKFEKEYTLEHCWQELQRKYKLVREKGGN